MCVCVCEREREKVREDGREKKDTLNICSLTVYFVSHVHCQMLFFPLVHISQYHGQPSFLVRH